ncbi:hypothetical protein GEMRC1_010306 [Eukaryota sp. GEM-RC1]
MSFFSQRNQMVTLELFSDNQVLSALTALPVLSDDVTTCIFCPVHSFDHFAVTKHLEEVHSFVIQDPQYLNDIPRYLRVWDHLLPSPKPSPFVISTDRSDDKLIRQLLNKEKLKFMLKLQQSEEKTQLLLEVVFSVAVPLKETGPMSSNTCLPNIVCSLLSLTPGLNLGRADGLVNVDRLLSILHDKMDNLECLYCEKLFKNREALLNHMKKKNHVKINETNTMFDQFYIVNYSNPGIGWKTLENERDDDGYISITSTTLGSVVDDDEHWSDWSSEVDQEAKCLYCNEECSMLSGVHEHMRKEHGVVIDDYTKHLTFLEYLQFINYTRSLVKENKCPNCLVEFNSNSDLLSHLIDDNHFFPKETNQFINSQFLIPFSEEDPLLFFTPELNESDQD